MSRQFSLEMAAVGKPLIHIVSPAHPSISSGLSSHLWWWWFPASLFTVASRNRGVPGGAAFPLAAPNCFSWLLSGILPYRIISGNSKYLHGKFSVELSAFSKCALHRAVFCRMRAGCHIPGDHNRSCSLWLCCDLSAFFLLKASWDGIDRWGGRILMEVRAQNLVSGRPGTL